MVAGVLPPVLYYISVYYGWVTGVYALSGISMYVSFPSKKNFAILEIAFAILDFAFAFSNSLFAQFFFNFFRKLKKNSEKLLKFFCLFSSYVFS
jgi:hypothetical protein